ncbi:MAG: hypothetical protein Q8S39_02395, partial [Ignavibacteria bacterium]|nr:hypothetical protein [Ignavibacteria bacterium]
CNENPADSRPRIIRPPQDMIWTADTIKGIGTATQLLPENLLVFSANDAWLVCWSDIARGLLWHFDGETWHESNIAQDVGGMRVSDIAGYSSSDLWTCGYSGDEIFLAHFDGRNWTKYNTSGIKGELLDMCKDKDGNIWACGRNGLIMKFDKSKWVKDEIYLTKPKDVSYFVKSIENYNDEIFTLVSSFNKISLEEKYYYARGNLGKWTLADSMIITTSDDRKWGYRNLNNSSNNFLSCGLGGIWKYQENNWNKIKNFSGAINNVFTANENHLIAVGDFQKAFFCDGTSWFSISSILNGSDPYFVYKNAWTSGYEAMIVGYGIFGNKEKLVVWRGK